MSTSMCLCLCSRYSSLCIPTFLLSLLAQRPSTTLFVGWGLCFSSCIRWSTTTGLSTLQKAAASHQRVLVSLWSILDHFEQVLFFSLWCGFRIWFDGRCCLCKLFLIHPRAHPQEARCFRKQLIGTEPITVIVFSQKPAIKASSWNGSSSPSFEMTHLHMEALACQLLGPWPSQEMTVKQTHHINIVIPLGCLVWVLGLWNLGQ